MKQQIMHIFARTPVHVGAGNSVGVVDSPIQRERHTRIPIIPGSSLKGVLADFWNDEQFKRNDEGKVLFGNDNAKQASAGNLLIGEGRVLAFPVRSAKGSFAWITCPLVLARYKRDNVNFDCDVDKLDGLADNQCFGAEDVLIDNSVVLEEYKFVSQGLSEDIAESLSDIISDPVWQTVATRLVIVNDEIFSYFVEHACEVVTRIRVDDETGVVDDGALFNQEQVPSETMFYAVVGEQRDKGSLTVLREKIAEVDNIIQIGGDETIGLGYCSVELQEVK